MATRRRTDRAAAVVLATIGLALLVFVAIAVAGALPRMRGDEGEHAAGETLLAVVLPPVVLGGLLTLLIARRLWWGRPMGRAFAGAWTAVVGFACVPMAAANGSALHAARVVMFEAGMVSFRWPVLGVQPASFEDGPYYYLVDEISFWTPAIMAVGALLVAGLLLAGRFAERGRDVRHGLNGDVRARG